MGGYIVDFYCPNKRLIFEIDGGVHNNFESKKYDEIRDKYFKELDYIVLRFSNTEVEQNVNEVLKTIQNHIE